MIRLPFDSFVAVSRQPYPGLYVRAWRGHMAIKPTRNELFSERNGDVTGVWCFRLFGVTLSLRRVGAAL